MVPIKEILGISKHFVQPSPSQLELTAGNPNASSGSEEENICRPWRLAVRLARPYGEIISGITDMKPETPKGKNNQNRPSQKRGHQKGP